MTVFLSSVARLPSFHCFHLQLHSRAQPRFSDVPSVLKPLSTVLLTSVVYLLPFVLCRLYSVLRPLPSVLRPPPSVFYLLLLYRFHLRSRARARFSDAPSPLDLCSLSSVICPLPSVFCHLFYLRSTTASGVYTILLPRT